MKEQYEWKWVNYPKLHIIDKIPIHLDIEITTRCNLSCPFCEHTSHPPELLDMSLEMYKKIIDEFAKKGGYAIKLCYLGEPLLHKDLPKMIKYAKKKGIIDTMIATNGTLLTRKLALKLGESGLDFVIFSIDSCNQDVYEKIRINGDLKKVIKGLIYLNNYKNQFTSKTPKIQIQVIPMKLNKKEIESGEYENFFKPLANIIDIRPYCEDYVNYKIIDEPSDFFCESVYQRMTIRVDGKMVICCGTRKDNKILGDIIKNSIEEIWTGKEFAQIRELMNERKSHLIDVCKLCSFRISRMQK